MRHLYVVIQSGWVGQKAHQQEAVRLHLLVNVLVCLSKAFGPTSAWWRPRARASLRPLHPSVAFLHQRAMPCLPFLGALLAGIFGVFLLVFGPFRTTFRRTVLAARGPKGLSAHLGAVAPPASALPPPPKPFCCLFTSASNAMPAFLGCAVCSLPHARPPPFYHAFYPFFASSLLHFST